MADRLLLLALLFSITCPAAWAQDPAGAEFRVNSYTTGFQSGPAVASAANGNFIVVWQGYKGSGTGVFGQRFSASGPAQGNEFQVDTFTTANQYHHPAVASDANGNFVVVWESFQDGSLNGVFGQRFTASGLPQGSEFQINSFTTGNQYRPEVASDADGNFVVVWLSAGPSGSAYGIFGRRFNAGGLPQGSEFQVDSFSAPTLRSPGVASDANGNFVVVWTVRYPDGAEVFARRFNASGVPQGIEFRVNSFTPGEQSVPSVASNANGNFVVAWQSSDQYASPYDVFGQRFNASGARQGSEFRANTYSTGGQYRPEVASDANGNFVVVWQSSPGQDGSTDGVFGQRFNAGGLPQGPEFQVNFWTTSSQYSPAVASAANGNFVVTWTSYGQDGSGFGVFGQRYGDLIFQDGFE